MALELFKPFVMKRLVETGVAGNIKSARKMVERAKPEVWDALEIAVSYTHLCGHIGKTTLHQNDVGCSYGNNAQVKVSDAYRFHEPFICGVTDKSVCDNREDVYKRQGQYRSLDRKFWKE